VAWLKAHAFDLRGTTREDLRVRHKEAAPRWLRFAGFAVHLLSALSVALLVLAMARYPGGTQVDRTTRGYDFFRNYFCDLIQPLGHNGSPNRGAALARAGMVLFGCALAPLWLLLPRMFAARPLLGGPVRVAGIASSLALPGVAFTPSQLGGHAHTLAILAAGVPALASLACGTAGLLFEWRRRPRLAALTLALLVGAAGTGALWCCTFFARWPEAWALPTAQKLTWFIVVAWMAAAAVAATAGRAGGVAGSGAATGGDGRPAGRAVRTAAPPVGSKPVREAACRADPEAGRLRD
jgi:hypothetical protein